MYISNILLIVIAVTIQARHEKIIGRPTNSKWVRKGDLSTIEYNVTTPGIYLLISNYDYGKSYCISPIVRVNHKHNLTLLWLPHNEVWIEDNKKWDVEFLRLETVLNSNSMIHLL